MVHEPPARELRRTDGAAGPTPILVVWELTLRCDQPCGHCGSRAGAKRERELSTGEVLEVAESLARLGAREVALIGGEAYLREDLHEIVRAVARLGMRPTMQTGGRRFTRELARSLRDAGLAALGVSVDGPARVHDKLRGNLGSHLSATSSLRYAREVGLTLSANTQVNMLSYDALRETAADLQRHGVQTWQVQLTGPMGRAADRPEWILEPWRVVEVIDTLAEIQLDAVRRGVTDDQGIPFHIQANNNLGYFGPHESVIRSRPGGDEVHYSGCMAGIFILGIESDGTVKGCPTLPTESYAGGNVRDMSIEEIWAHSEQVRFARDRGLDELWGFCKTCYYAETCRAGCSWIVHTTLGRRGNNPFCYYRVKQLERRGIRERLLPVARAPRKPYDHGRFEIVEEPLVDRQKA